MEQPSYFSIIPATVRYDNSLTMTERMLFGEITALSNKNGYCTASNGYFANLYRNKSGNPASKPSVSRWIRHLNEHGYIKLEYVWNDSKTIKARRMFPILDAKGAKQNERGVNKNVNTPYQEREHPLNKNVKENNTSNNNTSNNISSSSSHSKPSPQNETVDNSKDQKDEEEETKINSRMNKLFFSVRQSNKINHTESRPTLRQLKQIRIKVARLPDDAFKEFSDLYDQRASAGLLTNPIGYLITMLNDELEIEKEWYKK